MYVAENNMMRRGKLRVSKNQHNKENEKHEKDHVKSEKNAIVKKNWK